MRVVESESMEWAEYSTGRAGALYVKALAAGEVLPNCGFWLALARYGTGEDAYETPRHRHTFEQIRYTVEGRQNYAPGKYLPEGWLAYFPAGAYYGPQREKEGTTLTLQFGEGYLTKEQRDRAQLELGKRGRFENGVFRANEPIDGRKNQDAVEAMFEVIHGRKLEYPEPRYAGPIAIDPSAFAWLPLGEGISHKPLGSFTERDVRISMVRWDDDASYSLGDGRTHFVFSLTGTVRVGGETHPPRTLVWSIFGEEVEVSAASGTEALVYAMPCVEAGTGAVPESAERGASVLQLS
jgi:hypothetical protein